jgi:hypothetical protein
VIESHCFHENYDNHSPLTIPGRLVRLAARTRYPVWLMPRANEIDEPASSYSLAISSTTRNRAAPDIMRS